MRRWQRSALVALAVTTLVVTGPLRAQCPDGTPPPCGPRQTPPSPHSIAVLPFANRSPDSADVYLAAALAREPQRAALLADGRLFHEPRHLAGASRPHLRPAARRPEVPAAVAGDAAGGTVAGRLSLAASRLHVATSARTRLSGGRSVCLQRAYSIRR